MHPYHREDSNNPYEMQESNVSPIYVAAPSSAALVAAAPNINISSQAHQDVKRKYHVKKKQMLKPMYTIKMTDN